MGWTGDELERRLGHQRECPLRTDDQLGEVVARRGLDDSAPGADDLSRRQHHLEPEDVMAGHAVLHRLHPARVGPDVAADRGAVLTGVDGVREADLRERSVELVELHAGLHHRHV